jgi:hypothetical protein
MSGMTPTNFYKTPLGGLMKWPRLCALLGLMLARAASGTDALYENDAIITYPGTVEYPPTIDATNFVNTGTFIIDTELYETWNTINYTNTGTMGSDVGYVFDTQTTGGSHLMAGSFNNQGEVDCGDYFVVTATNVVNPGKVNVPGVLTIINPGTGATGVAGLLQFSGQNVDLTHGALASAGATAQAVGFYGLTGTFPTNSVWDASIYLGQSYAYPALPVLGLAPPPLGFGFPNIPLNTTPYFNFAGVGTNLVIIRAVFIQDTSLNVSHNVYFDSAGLGVGGGSATVEWLGGYVNPATGNSATNYLYLNDDYLESVATNDIILNDGIPENFTFTESLTPLIFLAPTAPGFFNVFSAGVVTNNYAYVSAQLIATTSGTNSIPNGAITNLPASVQITAGRELNLAYANIAQPDYLSLQSSNQYDGNTGAIIAAPFSDINLGVTNGYLTITNLLPQSFPVWSGTVQAWSTRWLVLGSNTLDGTNFFIVTNDFRVEIVASQLSPTLASQVQDLTLHATNSLIISDAFNVMRKLYIDAQNLTLTTNVPGYGATSAEGELNLESANIFWPSSLPNLRWLTNSGIISTMNLTYFGSSASPYGAFVNRGSVTNWGGSYIWAQDFENYGTFYSGSGSFILQSQTTTLTNGSIIAGGDLSITAASMVVSNVVLQGRSLTLQVTNLLTDTSVTNGNVWSLSGTGSVGLNLPRLPGSGDLLGTMVSVTSPPPNKQVVNTWAGQDRGASNSGYTNNVAIGQLILDAQGAASVFTFNGTGASNAMYVDELELFDYASYTNHDLSGNLPALVFNTNMVIYYAQALASVSGGGMLSVAEKLNGKNNNHLRWVPTYAGHFSSTNIVYPDGTTNGPFNAALAQSTDIDSDGDGTVNAYDLTPFFVPSELNFTVALTNTPPPKTAVLTWDTIPLATNSVLYSTNLTTWQVLTNFVSPIPYPSPATNVTVFDTIQAGSSSRFYRVQVTPWLTYPF